MAEVAAVLPDSGCRISVYLPHTWWTPEEDPDEIEDWHGLAGHDGSAKASGKAYIRAARLAQEQESRPKPPAEICAA